MEDDGVTLLIIGIPGRDCYAAGPAWGRGIDLE